MTTSSYVTRPPTLFVETLKAMLHGWHERLRLSRHLSDIGEEEAVRMLRDSGISSSEIAGWLRAPFATEDLAGRMMGKLGLAPSSIQHSDPMVMRDIERVCMACRSRRRCRRSLARGQASAEYGAFCPNAATFEALQPKETSW